MKTIKIHSDFVPFIKDQLKNFTIRKSDKGFNLGDFVIVFDEKSEYGQFYIKIESKYFYSKKYFLDLLGEKISRLKEREERVGLSDRALDAFFLYEKEKNFLKEYLKDLSDNEQVCCYFFKYVSDILLEEYLHNRSLECS